MRWHIALFISMTAIAFAAGCPNVDIKDCDAAEDCGSGEQCVDGKCVARCADDGDCPDGEACADDGTCFCPAGASCDGGEGEGEGEGEVRTVEACLEFDRAFDHRLMLRSDEATTYPAWSDPHRDDPTQFNRSRACDTIAVRADGFLQVNDAVDGGGDANYAAINVNDTRCGVYGDAVGQVGELLRLTVEGDSVPFVSAPQECDGDVNCSDTDPSNGCDLLVDLRDVF